MPVRLMCLMGVFLVSLAACGDPPPPKPLLWLEPSNHTTNVGDGPIAVRVEAEGPLTETGPLLDEIISNLSLESEGDGRVDVEFEKVPGPPPESASVTVLANEPLKAGWHVLRLAKIPERTRRAPWGRGDETSAVASRFNTTSAPTIQVVKFCEKPGELSVSIALSLSERVVVSDALQRTAIRVEKVGGAECAPTGSAPGGEPVPCKTLFESCSGISLKDAVRLTVSAGIRSESGVPLTNLAGEQEFSETFDLTQLPETESVCRIWVP